MKLECEKLATEKIEIQRHYVMVSDMNKLLNLMEQIEKDFFILKPKFIRFSILKLTDIVNLDYLRSFYYYFYKCSINLSI